jgi:predicted ATPase/transcriptional regulator with XRE-family HTH domain/Tfp pilus assembly protein PilF
MNDIVSFGAWLKLRRTALDLTQWDLAERVGCSREAIQKIEAGTRRPSKQIAELLIACLDIPLEERPTFVRWARLGPDAAPPELPLASASSPSAAAMPIAPVESAPPSSLPAPLTTLIGRDEEVEAVRRSLLRDEVRLLTLVGPPGIGKTRLGIAAAARLFAHFRDGVHFVALDTVNDTRLVITTIATSLGLKPSEKQLVAEAVVGYLRDKHILLVLDNFEQVLDAGPQILQLLSACPGLKALVTSREPLHAYGECRFQVPPLELPDRQHLPDRGVLAGVASVVLFTQRAQALKPDWALTSANVGTIAAICLHLDGLPLAIELAAARIEDLAPEQILAGLGDRLKLLKGDLRYLPPRQQTLRGAIDWSYHLLTIGERMLFRRLGVFVGSCNLAAIQAVCNTNHDLPFEAQVGVSALVTKSLMHREAGVEGEPRWKMLESIREYARERLEASDEAPEIHRLHAEYCVALTEAARPQLFGSEQATWLARLEQDHDNIRAALAWSTDYHHDATKIALRLSAAQAKFWYMRGHAGEGRRWLQAALELPVPSSLQDGSVPGQPATSPYDIWRAKVLRASGALAFVQGDYETSRLHNQAALLLAQQTGDRTNAAACLVNLGTIASQVGEYAQARVFLAQALSLERELGDKPVLMLSLDNLGHMAMVQGDNTSARSFLQESLALERELGDRYSMAYTLIDLAEIAIDEQDFEDANQLLEESLNIMREIADELGVGRCLTQFANLVRARCNYQKAGQLYKEGLVLSRKVGDKAGGMDALRQQAELYLCLGQVVKAVRLWSTAETLGPAAGAPIRPRDRSRYAQLLAGARTQLGEETFQQAWKEGSVMNFEQAVEASLLDSGPTLEKISYKHRNGTQR